MKKLIGEPSILKTVRLFSTLSDDQLRMLQPCLQFAVTRAAPS